MKKVLNLIAIRNMANQVSEFKVKSTKNLSYYFPGDILTMDDYKKMIQHQAVEVNVVSEKA